MVKYKILVSPVVFEQNGDQLVYIQVPWDIDMTLLESEVDTAEEAIDQIKCKINKIRGVINE